MSRGSRKNTEIHWDVSSNCLNDENTEWVFLFFKKFPCIFQGSYNNAHKEVCFHEGEIMTIRII